MSEAESDGQFKDLTFEELCEVIRPIAEEYGMIRVYLFGSRARGDNRPDSDYDICVLVPPGMGLFKMGGFYGRLEEALGEGIDVITEGGMSEEFRRMISPDMRLVYGA